MSPWLKERSWNTGTVQSAYWIERTFVLEIDDADLTTDELRPRNASTVKIAAQREPSLTHLETRALRSNERGPHAHDGEAEARDARRQDEAERPATSRRNNRERARHAGRIAPLFLVR